MLIIGHRGAKGLAPENTLASIKKALSLGVDIIEIDIRVTKDGLPVLSHDRALFGLEFAPMIISHHTYDQLRRQKPDLCTLEEAIKAVKQRVPLMVEVKPEEPTQQIVAVIKKFFAKGWKDDDFFLASFSQRTLKELHKQLPKIHMVVLERFLSIAAVWRARQLKTRYIGMNQEFVWFGFITSISSRGYKLFVYTLDDASRARRWAKYGLAGVITNRPDLYKDQTTE